jgi:hypothetical protein
MMENFKEIPVIEDVEELSVLVPGWQIAALAEAAENEGLTIAQFVRRLISRALPCTPISA